MTAQVDMKYRAFLSYAHADARWGRWLHRQLERFLIPNDLVGSVTPIGRVPETLRPIFRDRDDFTGGHRLESATIEALEGSAALIVLCSRIAAERPAVNEEVRLFRSRHPDRPIIPVVVDGVAPENFPPALRYELTATGEVTDRPISVLGTDLRDDADGKLVGLAKIVAGLIGVSTDDIVRRSIRDQRRRQRQWIVGLSTIAASLAGLASLAEFNRRDAVEQRLIAELKRAEAERNFEIAKDAADTLVFDLAQGLRDHIGVNSAAIDKMLTAARSTFDRLTRETPTNAKLQRGRMVMLNNFARTYIVRGNVDAAIQASEEALAIAVELANNNLTDGNAHVDVSVANEVLGDGYQFAGDFDAAIQKYKNSIEIRSRLSELFPGDVVIARALAVAQAKLGEVHLVKGDVGAASTAFGEALALHERILSTATSEPKFATRMKEWTRDVAVAHGKVGSVRALAGDFAAALESYQAGLKVTSELFGGDTSNSELLRDVAIIRKNIGDMNMLLGKMDVAQDDYRVSLAAIERLVDSDSQNAKLQRDAADGLFRLALSAALNQVKDKGALREVGDLYRFIHVQAQSAELDQILARVRGLFGLARDKIAARKYLLRGHQILTELQASSPLPESGRMWLSVFQSALEATEE